MHRLHGYTLRPQITGRMVSCFRKTHERAKETRKCAGLLAAASPSSQAGRCVCAGGAHATALAPSGRQAGLCTAESWGIVDVTVHYIMKDVVLKPVVLCGK